ncbi:MAG: endolytic transglycosylase MltG [Candidatus Subteraquimicrobiales bacterium]|nr:endolytic transglycosylase MltG [Candidatus Subteraquimicrobiales bacterium]
MERKKKISLILFTILVLLSFLFLFVSFLKPVIHSSSSNKSVQVVIEPNFTACDIAFILGEKKVINYPALFKHYLTLKEADRCIYAGKYVFNQGISYKDALQVLKKGPILRFFVVTIPEGFTIDQIASRLASKTKIDEEEFKKLAKEYSNLTSLTSYDFLKSNPTTTLEGYFFPKTYKIDEKTTAEEFIHLQLKQFGEEISKLDWSKAKESGLTVHEIVTIASLIEREARLPEERGIISAVIHNRLKKKMLLEICATVQYVLPEHKTRLTYEDLKIDSPYNTYLYPGLPPGPICNPGLECLKAALNPADVDYLYYVLKDPATGEHIFTRTYDEFFKAKQEAKNNW